jgi:type IV pilus assembly protein PilY1
VPAFRNRPVTVLGDIVGSAPVYVAGPSASYYDDFEAAAYSGFVAAWRGRAAHVYVGANDGMLHAFDAVTGDEKFAYVPNLVFDSLSAVSAIPFNHRYNVDGTPAVADVFYDGAWHTLLVAGLRGGGRGLYALDVTDPSQFTEAGAGSVVRWEFNDPDLGYVFAPPTLVKTNNGRWSVIVGNGYNSRGRDRDLDGVRDGDRAVLFVIDAETGATVRRIDAGAASSNGLSAPAAVDVDGDGIVDVVYAGDLNGRLWKFDLSSASADTWALALNGAPLFDAGENRAITSRPDVTRTPKGGYLVTFGTGRYLTRSDPGNTRDQTAFGIWDKDGTVVSPDELQEQIIETGTATAGGDTYRTSTHRVDPPTDGALVNDLPMITRDAYYATKRGWFIELPTRGERIVADARIRGGRVIFTSIIPDSSNACIPVGSSWVLEFDVFTGNRLDRPTFDVNNDGSLSADDFLIFSGAAGSDASNTSGWRIGGLASGAAFMGFKDGNATSEIKYLPTSDGVVVQKREAASQGQDARVMWRVVQ